MENNESASAVKLTQEGLKELLHYDSETGVFTRKVARGSQAAGSIAGWVDNGYLRIYMDGRKYQAHRLAWLYEYGYFPKELDHIDGIRNNNRIKNLRSVSSKENSKNSSMRSDNTSGHVGVRWEKARSKWRAQIKVGTKNAFLGYFINKEDAIIARKEAEKKYGYHPNHGKAFSSRK